MGPVTMGPPQEAPVQAGGLMASGGRLWMEEGVSGARARLLRLVAAAGAFAASLAALLACPREPSPKATCRVRYISDRHAIVFSTRRREGQSGHLAESYC